MTDEDETIVVCARMTTPLYIPDNRIGRCAECGARVQFRPHAPKGKRICMECIGGLVDDNTRVTTTPRMVEDLRAYYRKKLQ